MRDVLIIGVGVSIAKDSGNDFSTQGKRNLALSRNEPCSPASKYRTAWSGKEDFVASGCDEMVEGSCQEAKGSTARKAEV